MMKFQEASVNKHVNWLLKQILNFIVIPYTWFTFMTIEFSTLQSLQFLTVNSYYTLALNNCCVKSKKVFITLNLPY